MSKDKLDVVFEVAHKKHELRKIGGADVVVPVHKSSGITIDEFKNRRGKIISKR